MKFSSLTTLTITLLASLLSGGAATPPALARPATFFLPSTIAVNSEGLFLDDLIQATNGVAVPHVKIAAAPRFGQTGALTRIRLANVIREHSNDLIPEEWTGADAVHISRKARRLEQPELQALLTAQIQEEHLEDGRLELEFSRPWTTIQIPDEPMTLHLSPLPASGISSYLVLRFSIEAGGERFGSWQIPVRSRVWRDMWVAARPLKRGDLLTQSDVRYQPLDILRHRNGFEFPPNNAPVELTQDLVKGRPLTDRHVRLKPLVKRRQIVDAQFRRGSIHISMKVEVLEDGVGGQRIRVRNNQSRRELYARVLMEGVVAIDG